jgi:hypothetical protein
MMIHHVLSGRHSEISRPTSGTSSKKGFTPNSCPSWKRCSRSATDISACGDCPEEGAPNKRRARRNALTDIMSKVPYEEIRQSKVELPKRQDRGDYKEPIIRSG